MNSDDASAEVLTFACSLKPLPWVQPVLPQQS